MRMVCLFFVFLLILAPSARPQDDHFQMAELKNLGTQEKIRAISTETLAEIYGRYAGEISPEFRDVYLEAELRVYTLDRDSAENARFPEAVQKAGIDDAGFLSMYEKTAAWAGQERQKSAKELYVRSRNASIFLPEWMYYRKTRLRHIYLELAAAKGHKQAQTELDALNKELQVIIDNAEQHLERIEKCYQDEK